MKVLNIYYCNVLSKVLPDIKIPSQNEEVKEEAAASNTSNRTDPNRDNPLLIPHAGGAPLYPGSHIYPTHILPDSPFPLLG